MILERIDEVRERPRGAGREQLERAIESLPLAGGRVDALQREQDLEPFLRPDTLGEGVEGREGVEREGMLALAENVVVLRTAGVREDVARVVLVEQEDLGVGVAEELGHEEPD